VVTSGSACVTRCHSVLPLIATFAAAVFLRAEGSEG